MRESPLRLSDKTTIVFGPPHALTQAIGSFMAEQGADVAFVGPSAGELRKFAENLMDNRQIRNSFGRSAAFETELNSEKDDMDAISRVAETFGGLDILIDTHLTSFSEKEPSIEQRLRMARSALKFLEGRQRGRIVFLMSKYAPESDSEFKLKGQDLESFQQALTGLKDPVTDKNVTINGVTVGVTEEFLLKHYPKFSLKDGIEKLKQAYPQLHLVEPLEVAATAAFLASPLGAGICTHILHVDRGLNA